MDLACLDLLNSDWNDHCNGHSEDRLQSHEWVRAFVERWGWQAAGYPDAAILSTLSSMRTLLRQMVTLLVAGAPPSEDDLSYLNRYSCAAPVSRQLSLVDGDYRLEIVPVSEDWQWILAEIGCSFVELLTLDPRRVKICKNSNCHWVFYDESKSRTRCWCNDDCGNLIKVRRFRERQKETQPTQ